MKKELNIEVDIRNKNDFVSEYNDNTLSPALKKYLLNEIAGYDINSKINLNIYCKFELTDEEKDKYKKIIIKEFKESKDELLLEIAGSNIKKVILFTIGMFFIVAAYFLNHIFGEILVEVFTVFGWVALWEVAYAIFFTDASRRRNIKKYNQIINSKIKFK